jgi:hypothetical protein
MPDLVFLFSLPVARSETERHAENRTAHGDVPNEAAVVIVDFEMTVARADREPVPGCEIEQPRFSSAPPSSEAAGTTVSPIVSPSAIAWIRRTDATIGSLLVAVPPASAAPEIRASRWM